MLCAAVAVEVEAGGCSCTGGGGGGACSRRRSKERWAGGIGADRSIRNRNHGGGAWDEEENRGQRVCGRM